MTRGRGFWLFLVVVVVVVGVIVVVCCSCLFLLHLLWWWLCFVLLIVASVASSICTGENTLCFCRFDLVFSSGGPFLRGRTLKICQG